MKSGRIDVCFKHQEGGEDVTTIKHEIAVCPGAQGTSADREL